MGWMRFSLDIRSFLIFYFLPPLISFNLIGLNYPLFYSTSSVLSNNSIIGSSMSVGKFDGV